MLPTPEEITDLDEQERRIYSRFYHKVGDGPAAFFLDACRIMHATPRPVAATHLVGHCSREIESAMRALLVPIAKDLDDLPNERVAQIRRMLAAAGIDEFSPEAIWWMDVAREKGGETRRKQIKAILREIGVPEDDPIATTWLLLDGATRAHRKDLSVEPVDSAFENDWQRTKDLLDFVLERYEQRYLIYYELIEDVIAKPVSAEGAQRLKKQVPQNIATYKHLFGSLDDPQWFPPLRARGFFEHPFRGYWPPAVYLRKIASRLPLEVLKTIIAIDTDSVWTHMEFADAVRSMPVQLMARWALHEIEWIGRQMQIGWLLPHKYGEIVASLARGGETDAACAILTALFKTVEQTGETAVRFVDEPPGKMQPHDIHEFCTLAFNPIVELAPSRALQTFVDLLKSVLTQSVAGFDDSHLWRGSIVQGGGMYPGRRNELVSAILAAARRAIDTGSMAMADVLSLLDQQPNQIFHRIALYILSLYPVGFGERIARELGDLDDLVGAHRDEKRLVLANGFGHLTQAVQQSIRETIDAGPDICEFRERLLSWRGSPATDAEVEAHRLRWQTDLGGLIADIAGEDFALRHQSRRAVLASIHSAARAPRLTIKTAAELRTLGPKDAVAYALKFLAQDERRESDELARNLGAAAEANPPVFSAEAREFEGLPPYFIAWFFHGLTQAVKRGAEIEWQPIFELAAFVVDQPLELPSVATGREYGWAWPRLHLAWILQEVFRLETVPLQKSLADTIATLLLQLVDVNAGDEQPFEPDGRTVADRAFARADNSVRGVAIQTLVDFLFWSRESASPTYDWAQPRAMDALARSLQPSAFTIRCAIGMTLGLLVEFAPEWIALHRDRMFSTEDAGWEAVFVGYVTNWRSSRRFLELLNPEYERAISKLVDADFADSHLAQGVGTHLIELFWRGTIQLSNSLLAGFFDRAPGKLRGHAMWLVTHSADRAGTDLEPEVRQRLNSLWEWRIAVGVTAGDRDEELHWFGYYVTHVQSEVRWQIENLFVLIQAGVRLSDSEIVSRLAEGSEAFPVLAYDCYELLLKGDRRQRYFVDEEGGRIILCNALRTRERTAAVHALINSLASDDILTFRDLLNGDCDGAEDQQSPGH
ncbi:MAG: hypothetical protein QOC81_2806 [Thermoanaerobaculia bacterium]|jgi:hypothetical protein|nr:hypothetical protein [Thermoanaerobaculia bacterium]